MPIYRNPQTGHTVEVLPNTRLPKVYEKVSRSATAKTAKPATAKKDEVADKAKADKKADEKPATKKADATKAAKDTKPATAKKDETKK